MVFAEHAGAESSDLPERTNARTATGSWPVAVEHGRGFLKTQGRGLTETSTNLPSVSFLVLSVTSK